MGYEEEGETKGGGGGGGSGDGGRPWAPSTGFRTRDLGSGSNRDRDFGLRIGRGIQDLASSPNPALGAQPDLSS